MYRLMKWCKEELWKWALCVLGFVVMVSLLSGCKTKYVPLEKVVYRETARHDTLHTSDSVYVHDSIRIEQKGDTLYNDRWHKEIVLKHVYKVKTDSFISRDSIPVPYPVERELSRWERFQLKYAVWSMGAACALLIVFSLTIYKRIRDARNRDRNQKG